MHARNALSEALLATSKYICFKALCMSSEATSWIQQEGRGLFTSSLLRDHPPSTPGLEHGYQAGATGVQKMLKSGTQTAEAKQWHQLPSQQLTVHAAQHPSSWRSRVKSDWKLNEKKSQLCWGTHSGTHWNSFSRTNCRVSIHFREARFFPLKVHAQFPSLSPGVRETEQ